MNDNKFSPTSDMLSFSPPSNFVTVDSSQLPLKTSCLNGKMVNGVCRCDPGFMTKEFQSKAPRFNMLKDTYRLCSVRTLAGEREIKAKNEDWSYHLLAGLLLLSLIALFCFVPLFLRCLNERRSKKLKEKQSKSSNSAENLINEIKLRREMTTNSPNKPPRVSSSIAFDVANHPESCNCVDCKYKTIISIVHKRKPSEHLQTPSKKSSPADLIKIIPSQLSTQPFKSPSSPAKKLSKEEINRISNQLSAEQLKPPTSPAKKLSQAEIKAMSSQLSINKEGIPHQLYDMFDYTYPHELISKTSIGKILSSPTIIPMKDSTNDKTKSNKGNKMNVAEQIDEYVRKSSNKGQGGISSIERPSFLTLSSSGAGSEPSALKVSISGESLDQLWPKRLVDNVDNFEKEERNGDHSGAAQIPIPPRRIKSSYSKVNFLPTTTTSGLLSNANLNAKISHESEIGQWMNKN